MDHHEVKTAPELVETGLRKTQGDPVCNYKFRILKARLAFSQTPKESLQLLATPPPLELEKSEFQVRRLLLQGEAEAALGAYDDAKLRFEEAENLATSIAPELLARIALARGNLANSQKNSAEAEQDYAKALILARKYALAPVKLDALVDLGFVLLQRERFDEAINQFGSALELARELHDQVAEETILGNLGYSYFQLGNIEESVSLLQQAKNMAAKLDEKWGQQSWADVLGNVYFIMRDYSHAQILYAEALSLAKSLGDRDLTMISLHNLAQLELARGNLDAAENYSRDSQAQSADHTDPYLVLTTAEIAKARGRLSEATQLLRAMLGNPKTRTNLRWRAESDLANVYVGQNKFDDAEREFEKAVQIVEKASVDVKQEERRMSILDAWPFYDDYIRFLVERSNPTKALQIAEFSRARTLAEAFGINSQQRASSVQVPLVRRLLASRKQIILAYWLSDKASYLWVITPALFQIFTLPPKNDIDEAIQGNSRQMLTDHREVGESSDAQRLYEMLVRPAEKLIPKNARVTIIPNRSLYKLNFETLVVPGAPPHYWIEDVQIDYESSIALLATASHRRPNSSKGILLTGATVEVNKEFPLLKNAAGEMDKVESHFPGQARVIEGRDATPRAYRSGDPGRYRIIDFVTHGTASETSPLDSAIILSADPDGTYKLYAREIKDIPLHADLVTISACYGMGAKTYSGEGIVGLAWAFMRAGAHQVIGALWEVDEASSPQLMDDFYGELTHGKSAAEALRDAKLKMLRSNTFYRHPYYWASLQLYTGS